MRFTLFISSVLAFSGILTLTADAVSRSQLNQSVKAKACLLVDLQTGQVLYSRRATVAYPPASTVKLMTALLVWEQTRLRGDIKVVTGDTRVEPSHVPLRVGEVVSVRDMTRTLLVGSDNDSALVLARKAGGSYGRFIQMMNQRAKELGCRNTIFKNPNGLPATGQVTTCKDLMKIFQKVIRISALRQMCTTKGFTLKTAVGSQWVKNHNRLLGRFAGMGPAKTGWTYASRHTYAASVERNGREIHLTLLNSPNKWTDARLLFEYAFGTKQASKPKSKPQAAETTNTSVVSKGVHRVQKGETLYSISRKYGVSVNSLSRLNNIRNPNVIRSGMVLYIPK
ncbi:MAG: LysM peptidoglycan-binding domain-containing protein [Verrucomicrobiota bacterium]